jgi:hypothetical protein
VIGSDNAEARKRFGWPLQLPIILEELAPWTLNSLANSQLTAVYALIVSRPILMANLLAYW